MADRLQDRIVVANKVLETFAHETQICSRLTGRIAIEWTNSRGDKFSRRWQTRGQDFYPTWKNQWGHGGTACVALSQLVRWCRNLPILSIASWKYWASDTCRLFRNEGDTAIKLLLDAGYPERVSCVLCGGSEHIGDWWSLDGVSGPCCSFTTGCRQTLIERSDNRDH